MIKNGNQVLPVCYIDGAIDFEFKDKFKTFFLKKPEFLKEVE